MEGARKKTAAQQKTSMDRRPQKSGSLKMIQSESKDSKVAVRRPYRAVTQLCKTAAQKTEEQSSCLTTAGAQSQEGQEQDGKVAEALRNEQQAQSAIRKLHGYYREELRKQEWLGKKSLKKANDNMLKAEHTHSQQFSAITKDLESTRAELNAQKECNSQLSAALDKAEQELKSTPLECPKEHASLISALEEAHNTIATLQTEQEAAKDKITTSQSSHKAQVKKQATEMKKVTAALKEAEEKLNNETLRFQEESAAFQIKMERTRTSGQAKMEELQARNETLYAALEEQKEVNGQLKAALDKAESEGRTAPPQWEEEKTALTVALEKSRETRRAQLDTIASHKKQVEDAEKSHKAEMKKISEALKAAEERLNTETQRFQKERADLEVKAGKSRASCLAQMKDLKDTNRTLAADLEQLKSERLQWEEEKVSLTAEKEKSWAGYQTQLEFTASLQKQVKELTVTLEMSLGLHRAQQEEREAENHKTAAALKETQDQLQAERLHHQQEVVSIKEEVENYKAACLAQLEQNNRAQLENQEKNHQILMAAMEKRFEDQLTSERLLHQKEKLSMLVKSNKTRASHLIQLDEQRKRNDTLVAALEKAQGLLECHRAEWQEATASLTTTLQEKEQEWDTKQNTVMSQLEELQAQINKKKNRRKWYKFF